MEEHKQFDFVSGQYEAEKGMELAGSTKEAQEWIDNADATFEQWPIGTRFTGDHLRQACGVVGTGANKNNVVGGWFHTKAREHRIRFTGQIRKSQAVSCHARDQKVWEKLN